MNTMSGQLVKHRPDWWLSAFRALRKLAWLVPLLWLSLGAAGQAQAQACTQFTVFSHPTYQAFRTNSATGSCTLPSGTVMSWNHVGANRGLQSFGCTPYDPTYWMDGGTMTVTFSTPVNDVGFIIWGLDGGDSALVTVGTASTQAAPQTLANEFTDLCPGFSSGTAPTVTANLVHGNGGGYFGQIGVRATDAGPYTVLELAITGSGGGFGLVGVGSPTAIGPPPAPAAPISTPTLSAWGMFALATLMALGGVWAVRRRRS
jgi:IPTL-CTERM motif